MSLAFHEATNNRRENKGRSLEKKERKISVFDYKQSKYFLFFASSVMYFGCDDLMIVLLIFRSEMSLRTLKNFKRISQKL
jgi:hypothetical protein